MTQVQSTQPASPSGALDYARDGQSRRRRRRRRLLALLSIAILLAGAVWWWREPLSAHAKLHYAQYQCANHEFPSGTLVASTSDRGNEFAAPLPACWSDYLQHGGVNSVARLSSNYYPRTIAFLHRLQSPSGKVNQIVAVDCIPLYLSSASVLQALTPFTVTPADFWSFSSRPSATLGKFGGGYPVGTKIDVFGGQVDPTDPSRFTIDYKMEDVPGVIEGQLLDNGDVTLKLRTGSPDGMDRYKKKTP